MKFILIIIISLILISPLSVHSNDGEILYGWETFNELQWMSFGNGKPQPKYIGEVNNGKPDGIGILYYPSKDGEKVVGSWKEGKQWNTEHFNKDGNVIGRYVDGEIILGVLYYRRFNDKFFEYKWYEYGDDQKYLKYVGEIKNGKPNGQGIFYYTKTRKYEGQWKDGEYHGKGTFYRFHEGDYTKTVGEFKDGNKWNTKTFDKDQIMYEEVVNGETFDISIYGDKYKGESLSFKEHQSLVRVMILLRDNVSTRFTWFEKLKYVGEYKEGKPSGQGTLFFDDGSKWEGQWIDGKEWETKHFSENGTIIGKFSNGKYFK